MEKAVEQRAVVTCRRFYHNCLKDPLTFEAFDAYAELEYIDVCAVKYYIVSSDESVLGTRMTNRITCDNLSFVLCVCGAGWRRFLYVCLLPVFVSVCLPYPMSV